MSIQAEIRELEARLESLRRQENAKEVMAKLEAMRVQLERDMEAAQALAESIGLHFVYVSGYDYFKIVNEDEWNSSSIC